MSERYGINLSIVPHVRGEGFFSLMAMRIPFKDGKPGVASVFHEEIIEVAPEARCEDDVLPMTVDLLEILSSKFLAAYAKQVRPSITDANAQALDELLTLRYPD
jgi:hypothetical protein